MAEFHLSGGKKVVADFLVDELKGLFSVGVAGLLQSVQKRVPTVNGKWRKIGVRMIHGRNSNAFRKKAVTLEVLVGLHCLKSFVLL